MIEIHGHIGESYVDELGTFHKGVQLADVIIAAKPFVNEKIIRVSIASPGGRTDIGDAIFNYLESLKANGALVETIQDGIVGSIATKIFLAGNVRIVDDRFPFFIHNPWMQPFAGDSEEILKQVDELKKVEKDLEKFYSSYTGIDSEALSSLMNTVSDTGEKGTSLTADQALKLGFATGKKASQNIMAKLNIYNSMDKNIINNLVAKLQTAIKALAPENQIKSMALDLEGGAKLWAETEDPSKLEGVAVFNVDAEGNRTNEAYPDGTVKLADGRELTIAGGKVTAIAEPAMASADELLAKIEQLAEAKAEARVKAILAEKEKDNEKAMGEIVDAAIQAFKKDFKVGTPPNPHAKGGQPQPKAKTIASVMAELRDKRKKEINNK